MRADPSITTAEQYIASLPDGRREDVRLLHELIRKTVPSLGPFMSGGMLGYGPHHYRYASGREGDAAVIGLMSQKQHLSLYACAADANGYIAEQFRDRLPKANVGKSCVRFKRAADLDLKVVKELLKAAAKAGGMGAV